MPYINSSNLPSSYTFPFTLSNTDYTRTSKLQHNEVYYYSPSYPGTPHHHRLRQERLQTRLRRQILQLHHRNGTHMPFVTPPLSHTCISLTHTQATELMLKNGGVAGTSMSSNAATGSGLKSRGATGPNIVTSHFPFVVHESY
jgi:hypothetical protein